jgi:hypothetical protein
MGRSVQYNHKQQPGKGILVLILFLFSATSFFSQTKEKDKPRLTDTGKSNFFNSHTPRSKDFHAVGHSLFFDLNLSPIKTYAPDTTDPFDSTTKFSRIAQYSFYNISYFFRYNVYQPTDNKAFSITINPALGLGFSQSKRVKGFGVASGAVYLGYEWGLGSTYRTDESKGAFVRLGAEYYYTPLLIESRKRDDSDIRSWISPVISFGTRRETEKARLLESNFKLGWGLSSVGDEDNGVNPYLFARAFNFRYSLVVYLDH